MSSIPGSNKPTVVLIHYTFGNYKNLQRHIEMFNELGYPTATFDLKGGNSDQANLSWPFLYTTWITQVTNVLDSITGPKIVFSMSFPSYAGLIASSVRTDIEKYICDGGPFTNIPQSIYRLYNQQGRFHNPLWRSIVSLSGYLYLGPQVQLHLTKALERWPREIPILSLRGGKDLVVPPPIIDAVFAHHKNLRFSGFEITDAGHLDGLKRFPEIYTSKVREFLLGT